MKNIFIFFFKILKVYKKKRIKILIYEIFFSIKYFKTGNLFKIRSDSIMTDTIPSLYYFIHKISQFINKKKIKSAIDLGSGYGRITNFLNDSTKANIMGYELDKGVFDISKKNKKTKVNLENKNILDIDYKDLKLECFIINDPLHNKSDLEYLIKKIQSSMNNFKEKYYLVGINIEKEKVHVFNDYKLLKLISCGQLRSVRFYSN